jgi:protein dpy-30-like protein
LLIYIYFLFLFLEPSEDLEMEEVSEAPAFESEPKEAKPSEEVPVQEENVKTEPDVQPMEAEDASKANKPATVEESVAVGASGGEEKKESNAVPVTSSATTAAATPSQTLQPTNKKPKVDLQNLATRQYLEQTVVPILLQGLSSLAKTRPEDPIKYLANYLIEHKQDHEGGQDGAVNGVQ